ncbi:MAG: ribonuclease Y [Candidatus Omnitrophica bacterium]|nr:ribonuclease Y [Candidatus Omnitrophota bacterium]MBU4149836.1 ribonuclease Y [Candidatus Omnitrophota bacterium]
MEANLKMLVNVIEVLVFILTFFAGYFIRKFFSERHLRETEERAGKLLEESKKELENRKKELELESKDLKFRLRSDFEKETKDRRQELSNLEKRLAQKEENIDRKVDILDKKEKEISRREGLLVDKEKSIESRQGELSRLLIEEKQKLQRISGLSVEEAKKLFLRRVEDDAQREAQILFKEIQDRTRVSADDKAKEILAVAMQKCAAEHVTNTTVSVVPLPNDEMKGRIIGREGRNIRALEIATGVDVIIDDTPEAVILSCFDTVKREIARISLERLLRDGRIHPGRIEEVVGKVKQEMANNIKEEGEHTIFELGLQRVHPEIVKLIGRLKYRTSYGQNALQHMKEVALLMAAMAGELSLDVTLAKRIGLLHDIGKAVTHEVEGPHAKIGADLAKKYGEIPDILNAISSHHEEEEPASIYAVLLQAADAVSASRPGARRETLENYIKRLEKLESIADSFKGVEKAYAIQAGREIRIIVQPEKISDLQSIGLSREIKKKIEEGLEYPGQIKVTVIRETRAIEYAK